VIVVDTNVISELMRGDPHPAVLSWMAARPRSLLYTTYISQAEILHGIAALPEGRRRTALTAAAEAMFAEDFAGRLLPFERERRPANQRSSWCVGRPASRSRNSTH
jgi:toxin FitB